MVFSDQAGQKRNSDNKNQREKNYDCMRTINRGPTDHTNNDRCAFSGLGNYLPKKVQQPRDDLHAGARRLKHESA